MRETKTLAEGTFTISTTVSVPPALDTHVPGPPASVTGSDSSNTAPFRLSGDYVVTAAATSSECGFFWGGTLKSTDPKTFVYEQIPDGTTNLYGLDDGEYYVEASASRCSWSITFTPR